MTCIVGLLDNKTGKVHIGGDSCGIDGLDVVVRKDKKVFRNGEFVFGFASSFRMGQILQYEFDPPEVNYDDLMVYMVKTFIPYLRYVFKEGAYTSIESSKEHGGSFLVGGRGRLFNIQRDFQVGENLCGYMAIGCGEAYALGSLHATDLDKNLDPEWRLEQALQAASTFSGGVCAPFNFVRT